MTGKVSPYKLSRLLKLYMQGHKQSDIAKKLHVDQSTVSLHISDFNKQALDEGIIAASKEANVMDTVYTLHSLAAELKACNLTGEDAITGIKVMSKLKHCGVNVEQYPELVKAAGEMNEQGFIDAAMKLASLESSTGTEYTETVNKFETMAAQIEQKGKELEKVTTQVSSTKGQMLWLEKQKAASEKDYDDYLYATGMTKKRIQAVENLALLLKQKGITDAKLEEYLKRQQAFDKTGVNIEHFQAIIAKLGEITSTDGGEHLEKLLTDYGGLNNVIAHLNSEKANLQKQVAGVTQMVENKKKLIAQNGQLQAEHDALKEEIEKSSNIIEGLEPLKKEVKSLGLQKDGLAMDISTLEEQKTSFDQAVKEGELHRAQMEPLEADYQELVEKTAEKDKELQGKRKFVELFQAFLGFLQNNTPEDVKNFVALAPQFISWAKDKNYQVEIIEEIIISELTKGQTNSYHCNLCNVTFYVGHATIIKKKYKCPNCGNDGLLAIQRNAYKLMKNIVKVNTDASN